MTKNEKLRGIVLSLPTPTKGKYDVDIAAFKAHVTWLIDQGLVEGRAVLMAAGGLGTGYFLTREEHDRICRALVDAANGKVPTMIAIYDSSTKEAVRKARLAEDLGVDYLQVAPPHYMAPLDDEVFTHYSMISESSGEIGIMLYNAPWSTMNYELRPQIIEKLLELENVVGMKWASSDPANFVNVLKEFSNRLNFIDTSTLTTVAFQLGAKGYASVIGNIAPKTELYLLDLLEKKKYRKFDAEFKRIHTWRSVLEPGQGLSSIGIGEGGVIAALFAAVGKPIGDPLPPQRKVSSEAIARTKELLEDGALNRDLS
jgi:4-hydroxy-tetrahydrodipicolinate synthase